MRIAFTVLSVVFVSPFLLTGVATASAPTTHSVSLRVETTAPGTFPQGAQRVPLLTLHLQAPCRESVSLKTLSLIHRGLGYVSDIDRIYVLDRTKRVSVPTSLSRDEVSTVRLRGVIIPACTVTTLTVVMDLSATATFGGEHRLDLVGATANIPVVIQAASSANTLKIASVSSALVTAELLSLVSPVSYGPDQIVARLRLRGSGKDQSLLAITFTNHGSASNADLQNLVLVSGTGKHVSAVQSSMDDRTVTLTLDPPFFLGRGELQLLELHADVRASRRRTIRFTIEEPSDIQAEEVRRL